MKSLRPASLRPLSQARAVLAIPAGHRWSVPVLVVLGVCGSLAETAGVSLVVLFVQLLMGPHAHVLSGGALGGFLELFGVHGASATLVGWLIFALILIRGVIGFAYSLVSGFVRTRIDQHVQNHLHWMLLHGSYQKLRGRDQGELLDLMTTQSWSMSAAYLALARILINVCACVVFTFFLLAFSWQITVVAVTGSLVVSGLMQFLSGPTRRFSRESRAENQGLAARILASLQAMRSIRAFGVEGETHDNFAEASSNARATANNLEKVRAFLRPATEVGHMTVLWLAIAAAAAFNISLGATLACVVLLYRLQPHMKEMEENLHGLAELSSRVEAVLDMLHDPDMDARADGDRAYGGLTSAIEFEGVGFTYEGSDRPALQDANLTIPAGLTTAIVGASGAGKTTLINLLLRLYSPREGRIVVDGVPLEDIRRADWLGDLAIAGQDIDLIEDTIGHNIRMGKWEASDEEVLAAAELAGLKEVIEASAHGLEAWVGHVGMNLSGGQRQRIGLARAFLRDPGLLILDEATSALDTGLEAEIRTRMTDRFAGRTIVLITHRLLSALTADHLVCIENGRIVEEGAPKELALRTGGAFHRLLAEHVRNEAASRSRGGAPGRDKKPAARRTAPY